VCIDDALEIYLAGIHLLLENGQNFGRMRRVNDDGIFRL
jgi:hypothetical protein